jgi:predicted RNA-binding Zn-ribbon protein involved in translation (DUF1610 family)
MCAVSSLLSDDKICTLGKRRTQIRNKISELHASLFVNGEGKPIPYLVNPAPGTKILRCKACGIFFPSVRARVAFCPYCRSSINELRVRATDIVRPALHSAVETQRAAMQQVKALLVCPSCGWEGNQQRDVPIDIAKTIRRLDYWTEKAHCHAAAHMRRFREDLLPFVAASTYTTKLSQ